MSDLARVFFALWPDEALRQQLHQASGLLHQAHGGRRMPPDTVHLTLLFIGSLPRERLPELQAPADAIQAPKFDVAFDQADCWRHNRIAFLTASQPPAGLFDLVRSLETQASMAGIAFDRRPYKPHITLVRNADCRKAKPALAPILWAARDFVLVESRSDSNGASYSQLARWQLL
ncbi:MAG: RNA 2',3'-cyclic phosphodiesterase [Betaproteobacteria bacterium]|nr:RNA 2',3'-cyclic phosphodiesterase [Betaproteobacteria bacterium]